MALLVTLEQMKRIFVDTALTDEELTKLSEAITARIEEYCSTGIGIKAIRERFDSLQTIKPEFLPITKVVHLIDGDKGKPLNTSDYPDFPKEDWKTDIEYVSPLMTEGTDYIVYKDHITIPSPSGELNGVVLDYEYGTSIEDIPSSVYDVALDLARFQYFKETEGLLLFYDKQTFEERSYEFNSSRERQILARLNSWVRKLQGRGRIRVGVI